MQPSDVGAESERANAGISFPPLVFQKMCWGFPKRKKKGLIRREFWGIVMTDKRRGGQIAKADSAEKRICEHLLEVGGAHFYTGREDLGTRLPPSGVLNTCKARND